MSNNRNDLEWAKGVQSRIMAGANKLVNEGVPRGEAIHRTAEIVAKTEKKPSGAAILSEVNGIFGALGAGRSKKTGNGRPANGDAVVGCIAQPITPDVLEAAREKRPNVKDLYRLLSDSFPHIPTDQLLALVYGCSEETFSSARRDARDAGYEYQAEVGMYGPRLAGWKVVARPSPEPDIASLLEELEAHRQQAEEVEAMRKEMGALQEIVAEMNKWLQTFQ